MALLLASVVQAQSTGAKDVIAFQGGAWANTCNAGTNLNTSALALESGGNLDAILTELTSIDAKDFATQTTLAALLTELQLKADLTETQPISAASLPLPTGAATESTLKNVETYTNNARTVLQATGSSAQQVNGAYAVGDSYTGVEGFPIMFRDISGTLQVSFCNLVAPGFCLQYVQPADGDFEQVDFTSSGESYNLVASTDGTKANATYIDLDANKHIPVVGDVAHDSTDSGDPVKTGGVSYAFSAWDDADPGQTAVSTNGDRVQQQLSSKGWNVDQKVGRYVNLDDIEDAYDDVTTTNTSTEINLGHYRWLSLAFTIEESGTATDITFTLEVSTDGGTYVEYSNGFAQALVFTDNLIAAAGVLSRSYVFNVAPFSYARVKVTAAGTTASDTFTITYASAGLSN